ncbi:hypothetical protein ACFO4E_25480 [Nocardiopsis mangrovi]|uniref:Lipoprotein n=1 Tax=Nocardiopsis mangrovi TaxID=1179818 RepID=A0ABV9E237_9ACTN
MRTTSAAVIALLSPLVLVAGCAGAEGGPPAGGTSRPSPPEQEDGETASAPPEESPSSGSEVFVYNTYGDEAGGPTREPAGLTASEFTSFTGLTWRSWSADSAEARGRLTGSWCLPDCQDRPYEVVVELKDPQDVEGTEYFTTYEVTDSGDLPDDMRERMTEADQGRLMLPTSQ